MVAARSGKHLKRWAFPAAMLGVGAVAAAIVASLPQTWLDLLSWRLWLPHVLPVATPPVGVTGRILLALATLIAFAGVGALPLLRREKAPSRQPEPLASPDAVLPWLVEVPATPAPAPREVVTEKPAIAARAEQVPSESLLARATKRFARPLPTSVEAQSVRRADSHPDAPPRRPIMATADLGPPLPIAPAPDQRRVPEPERPLPADLDQPLAAFDPHAVPDVPREPVRAVAPLIVPAMTEPVEIAEPAPATAVTAPVKRAEPVTTPDPAPVAEPVIVRTATIDPGERFETFSIPAPVAPIRAVEPVAPRAEPLAALLERLERGANRRTLPEPARPASLDETLVQLRRLATG